MDFSQRSGSGCRRATLGPQLVLKKNTFQGFAVSVPPIQQQRGIDVIVSEALEKQPRLRKFQAFPRASRICTTVCKDNGTSEVNIVEECNDNTLIGVGDRLLYLLRRWQVTNLVLVVAHHDSSLSGRLLGGAEPYMLVIEAAKLVLKQHYLEPVAEAAKMPSEVAAAGATIASIPEPIQDRSQQASPAVCVMSSDTISTWPKHHQPTSDGGGCKGVKQGRINHFRHRKAAAAERNQDADRVASERIANVISAKSTGSLEWLGISRDEWRKLRSIRVPVRELHYLFMCLVILLETPIEQRDAYKSKATLKQQPQFVPSNFSWTHCRQVLYKSSEWSHRLRAVCGSTLAPSQASALGTIFQEPTFTESAFVRIAGGAAVKIFAWLQKLLGAYDETKLGMLRINVTSNVASQAAMNFVPVKTMEDDRRDEQQQEDPEQAGETSPIDRVRQNVAKSPKSSKRKKIVDPGRLFGRYHTTQ